MRRDWEKAKRRDMAKSQYDPIASFRPMKPKRWRRKSKVKYRLNPNPEPIQHRKHPEPTRVYIPRSIAPTFIQLVVTTEFFTATAKWRCISHAWSCVEADQPIRWLVGKTREQAHLCLLKMGACFRWVRPNLLGTAGDARPDQPAVVGTPSISDASSSPMRAEIAPARPQNGLVAPDGQNPTPQQLNTVPT